MRENFSRAFEGYFQWISKAGKTHTDNSRKKSPKIQAKKAKKNERQQANQLMKVNSTSDT